MTTVKATKGSLASRGPTWPTLLPIWRMLTSVRFAVAYISMLASLALLGVIIPQVPEPMRGNTTATKMWLEMQRSQFGPLTDPMFNAGLFTVFHTPWFLVAMSFLVVNVTVCTFNRWSPTFHNVFYPKRTVAESFFDRAHNRTTLAAVSPDALRSTLRRLRFSVHEEERNGARYVFADRFAWAQFATFISHMALILFISGGLVTRITGMKRDVFTGTGTTAPVFAVSNPQQLQVRIDEAIGSFGPKGNALDFRTRLTIFRNGEQVAQGTTTVNDPLKWGGYRFHQVGYFPNGAELVIRDSATGNSVFHETFSLDRTTAAPRVTISGADGTALVQDVIPPTAFLPAASGALVQVPNTGRTLWVGLTPQGDRSWRLLAYDPQDTTTAGQLRLDEGGAGSVGDLRVQFEGVRYLPSAVGLGMPGGGDSTLAQMTTGTDGTPSLLLVSSAQPAISLAPGQPVRVGAYEYEFVGKRAFAGIVVRRDSGAWFIWGGTAMLLIGLAITFYVPRRRLWIRLDGGGTHVASVAEKSGGFERDMRVLARRLGVPVPEELQEER
ncbi:MAG: cytochrome c biogenesis protein ResB [Chloroflexi bacterium]|nr:cytochrome c biogenesis protein ResB [Chloroflexota bacterium]